MSAAAQVDGCGSDSSEVRAQVERILGSRAFWHAEALGRFLRYIVAESLAGRAEAIKEYSLGLAVFGRGAAFDPKTDTIVRVQARRLRAKLSEYYSDSSHAGELVIELPKGAYVPVFHAPLVSPRSGRVFPTRRLAFAAGGVMFALAAGLAWLPRRGHPPAPGPAFEAIAVLPFASLSNNPDDQYLADGMTEALITTLGQAGPIRVIGRTSVNRYLATKKSIREVAGELNVDVVVEGTVTRSGSRLRVTANLIQVSPEKHIWAQSYEQDIRDVLALQNELAAAIANEIRGNLTPQQQARGSRAVNPEAQLAYWTARYFLRGRRDPESAQKSLQYAEQAVRLDPGSAPAHAAMAEAYTMMSNMGVDLPAKLMPLARSAALRAVALDADLAEAHVALGHVLLVYDWDWDGAERAARRVISLNPSDAAARGLLASYLAAVGRTGDAVAEIKRARELDPLSFYMNRNVGRLLYFDRKYDEALAELRQAGDMQPNLLAVEVWIAKCHTEKEFDDDAFASEMRVHASYDDLSREELHLLWAAYSRGGLKDYWRKLRELNPVRFRSPVFGSYYLTELNAYLGDTEEAFRQLEEAYTIRSGYMPWIKADPALDSLRPDPRFSAILRRMGLPD